MSLLHLELNNVTLAANSNVNFADSIPQPLLNILVGLGIVFAALIVIAGVISILKYITNLGTGNSNQTLNNKANVISAPVSSAADAVYGKNLVNDSELVAVITAAIMASMGDEAPADGLVVRSIRRVNNKRWQNA